MADWYTGPRRQLQEEGPQGDQGDPRFRYPGYGMWNLYVDCIDEVALCNRCMKQVERALANIKSQGTNDVRLDPQLNKKV